MEIKEYLRKQRPFSRLAPWDTLADAAERMVKDGSSALAVMDQTRVVGLITQKSLIESYMLGVRNAFLPVSDFMERRFLSVSPNTSVELAFQKIREESFPWGVVHETGGKTLGIISATELAEALIAEKDFQIHQLERYIVGPYPDYVRPRFYPGSSSRDSASRLQTA